MWRALVLLLCACSVSAFGPGITTGDHDNIKDMRLKLKKMAADNAGVELTEDEIFVAEHMPYMAPEHSWTYMNWRAHRKNEGLSDDDDEEHRQMYRDFHDKYEAEHLKRLEKHNWLELFKTIALSKWGFRILGPCFLLFLFIAVRTIQYLFQHKAKRYYDDTPTSPFRRKPARTVKVE